MKKKNNKHTTKTNKYKMTKQTLNDSSIFLFYVFPVNNVD